MAEVNYVVGNKEKLEDDFWSNFEKLDHNKSDKKIFKSPCKNVFLH